MYDLFIAPFADFEFMRRALVGAIVLAIAGAPLGVFLILRRMALAGDAMAHAILPGAAVGYLVAGLSAPAMALGGLAAGVIVALGAGLAARATILREDASLAGLYLVSLALGVTIVSLRGSSIDLLHVLFGNVLALDDQALILLATIATVTLLGLALLFRALVMETLDPVFTKATTGAGLATQLAFLGLLVLNLVAGFQALGTLMSVGLMMLPALAARLWTRKLDATIGLAAVFGAISAYAGLVASYALALPSGPTIVLAAGSIYFVSLVFGRAGGALREMQKRRHLEA
ncbi:MAG: metal ABC transporter permease [Rhodoblastus sp.]